MEVGIDVVSDGEMGKISYATYIKDRLSGFDGDTPREPGQDLIEHPRLLERLAKLGSTAKYRRPRCVADISVKDLGPMKDDIANMTAALAGDRAEGRASSIPRRPAPSRCSSPTTTTRRRMPTSRRWPRACAPSTKGWSRRAC